MAACRNGVIDKSELRQLLEAVSGVGGAPRSQNWVVDTIVDSVMASFDSEGSNTLSFDEFALLVGHKRNVCFASSPWR